MDHRTGRAHLLLHPQGERASLLADLPLLQSRQVVVKNRFSKGSTFHGYTIQQEISH
jgi:hypothetical protein